MSCNKFCASNPNQELCMRDCRMDLSPVPISKAKDRRHHATPYIVAGIAAVAAIFIYKYLHRR